MAVTMTGNTTDTNVLSYEDYLKEGETNWRYDIIDGVRINMASPTAYHQRVVQRITRLLEAYEEATEMGIALSAPCDVQITLFPLRTRQPDALFVSNGRLRGRPLTAPPPLDAVPELVVEVVSDSDRERVLNAKIADFASIGVEECWIVRPEPGSVEVLRLTADGPETVSFSSLEMTVSSVILPGLTALVSSLFPARSV